MKLCYSNICTGDISVTENKLTSKVYRVLYKNNRLRPEKGFREGCAWG